MCRMVMAGARRERDLLTRELARRAGLRNTLVNN
jgi:hypothetical protein